MQDSHKTILADEYATCKSPTADLFAQIGVSGGRPTKLYCVQSISWGTYAASPSITKAFVFRCNGPGCPVLQHLRIVGYSYCHHGHGHGIDKL